MIPRVIHYCWFGHSDMPELACHCIETWHNYMPDYKFKLWNEDVFDINQIPYTKEAYEAKKFAFVSDYVRLLALEQEGGLYMDVDFEVYKPFDDLLNYKAFAGFEGSKHSPLMMGVIASEPHGVWVTELREAYLNRRFFTSDGRMDLTTNVEFISARMRKEVFVQNGKEQDYKDLHIFPVDYFCPQQTSGEFIKTENTYCNHCGLDSWSDKDGGWKSFILNLVGKENKVKIIKLKRKLFG